MLSYYGDAANNEWIVSYISLAVVEDRASDLIIGIIGIDHW